MSRQAYTQYKPSGVAWLGEIPEHWDPVRLRYRAKINPIRSEINGLPDTLDVSFVPMESVHEYGGLALVQSRPLAEVSTGYTYFRDGDVLAAKITPCFENGKGAIAHDLMNGIGFGTTELHVLRPHPSMDRHFLFYVTISHAFRHLGAAEMYGAGGQKRVPEIFIRDFRQSIPPLKEQRTIAAFLDRETARIDALIEKKQRQIELLQEKRSALISHAVTKGLDPNARTKDSGIEWLGKIPAHWGVCLFKRVAKTSYGVGGEIDRTITDGTPVLSLPNVNIDGRLLLNDVPLKPLKESEKRDLLLRKGDLLFNWRNGSSQHLGKTAFFNLDGEYSHVSFLLRLRFDPMKHDSRYFQELLSGFRITGFFSSSKAGVNNTFNQSELDNLWVVVPPKKEQNAIAFYLTRETGKIDSLIGRVEKSINLLKEYRTALISVAVTGKIDVRST